MYRTHDYRTLFLAFNLKIQEHSSSSNQAYLTKLSSLFERLITHFIATDNTEADAEEDNNYEIADHRFYICTILMRQICNSSSTLSSAATSQHRVYLTSILSACLSIHKRTLRHVSKEKSTKISSFYIDFLRSYIANSAMLSTAVHTTTGDIDSVKFAIDLIRIFSKLKAHNSFELEFSFAQHLQVDKKQQQQQQQSYWVYYI